MLERLMKLFGYKNKNKMIYSLTIDFVLLALFIYMAYNIGDCTCVEGLRYSDLVDWGCNLSKPIDNTKLNNDIANIFNFNISVNISDPILTKPQQ